MGPLQALVQYLSVRSPPVTPFELTDNFSRKFFTVVVTLNGIGLLLAALNIWTYPRQYTGAFILGNLLIAILVRNELFGRLLYLIVNTCFAKVHTYVQVIQCLLISLSSGLLSGLGSGVRLFCSISAGKFFGISGMCPKTDPTVVL